MAREITVKFTAQRPTDEDGAKALVDSLARAVTGYGYDVTDLTYVSSKAPEARVSLTQSEYDALVAAANANTPATK